MAAKGASLTPRRRVELALRGGHADRVPFTVYEGMVPQCAAERDMRNRGLCIVHRRGVFSVNTPNVKCRQETWWEPDRQLTRMYYETPVGTLTTLSQPAPSTTWYHERMFKTPDDYKALLFLIKDEVYAPAYEEYAEAERSLGDDMICRSGFGLEPLQSLISGIYMDTAAFCVEWMDRRDEILKLYDAIVERRRRVYPLVAKSPALHSNYGGNVVPEIIGLETFEKYYLPHYHEAAEVMHRHGKLIGAHFDANCRLFAQAIAGTELDYVEAFTPAPDTDMALGDARAAWPGKALWLNFSSSVHLRSDREVEQFTVDMLEQVPNPDGIIMGITEDVPPSRWRDSYRAIMDGLDRHAAEHPALYA